MDRRSILKFGSTMSILPFVQSSSWAGPFAFGGTTKPMVDFSSDGKNLSPTQYCELLQKIVAKTPEVQDRYGAAGAVEQLENEIANVTGKEAALFLPSGTLANQLAIKVLSKDKSKVFVQEQSHVYRDESDAAQQIHGKRLMPLANGKANFTLDDLNTAIEQYRKREVFETGIGAISIENTVRRCDEEIFNITEIRKISKFARRHGFGMHLDGARLFMASVWSNISIREYSSHFDTVYVSLYKYLGAPAGAILAGDGVVISKVKKWMKLYGATMFQNWHNAAVALHFLDGFHSRLTRAKTQSIDLFKRINQIDGLEVKSSKFGSNTSKLRLSNLNQQKFVSTMWKNHGIRIGRTCDGQNLALKINETLLNESNEAIESAFKETISQLANAEF